MDIERITELEKLIRDHNELYWNKNTPEISDEDYDFLVTELLLLDPENDVPFEFAEKIIGKPVHHEHPMLSMNKAYTHEEVVKEMKKWDCDKVVISYKMDGAACSLLYEGGKLIRAATRGKDNVGEDITRAALIIDNIPRTISDKRKREVRGEVIMPFSVFNARFKDKHSHPRNLASGTLKKKNPKKEDGRGLKFYAYNLLNLDVEKEVDKFSFLKKEGFDVVPLVNVLKKDVPVFLDKFFQKKDKLDFGTDGLIITAGDISVHEKMGCTSHHPRYAIALKFQGESGITELVRVNWSISRTGIVTPVAIIKPIQLSGAKITKASIHNVSIMDSLGLSKGCHVKVTRRGEIIPHIEEVVKSGGEQIGIPNKVNGQEVYLQIDQDSDTAVLVLRYPKKSIEVLAGRVSHFTKVLDIDGLGIKIISKLCELGIVKDLDDLFKLDIKEMEEKIDRLGEKNATKIVNNINNKKEIPLGMFLRSLGIHELGKHVSKIIEEECGDSISRVFCLREDELCAIDSIGETIASSIRKGLAENADLIDRLLQYITIKKPQAKTGGIFTGKSFVFTGKMEIMKRNDAQAKVEELGGEAPSSVKKTLTYLVVGGDEKGSSKQIKAEKYNNQGSGIKIISEKAFIGMAFGDSG